MEISEEFFQSHNDSIDLISKAVVFSGFVVVFFPKAVLLSSAGSTQVGTSGRRSQAPLSSHSLTAALSRHGCSVATQLPAPLSPGCLSPLVTMETLQTTLAAFASCDTYFLFCVGVKNENVVQNDVAFFFKKHKLCLG